jgi:hypothetical protein
MIFFLSFYKSQRFLIENNILVLSDFGFEKGATYEMAIEKLEKIDHISFFLVSAPEMKLLPKNIINASHVCANESIISIKDLKASGGSPPLKGNITTSGVYTPIIADCSSLLKSQKLNFQISLKFKNPTTYLDIRQVKSLTIMPILICVSTILLVFWIINWIKHKSLTIRLHYFMSATFFLSYIMYIFNYILLVRLNKCDDDGGLKFISIVLVLLSRAILFSTLLLAAKGWCIIKDTVKFSEIALSLGYTFVFMALRLVVEFVYLGEFAIYVLLIAIVFIGLFIKEMTTSINTASLHVLAHLLVIQNEGIIPESTPIYLKHQMYQQFQYIVVIGCIMVVVKTSVEATVNTPEWVNNALDQITEMILLTCLGIIFRLRGSDEAGYTVVGSKDRAAPIEVALDDLDTFKLGENKHEGKQWEVGMELSPQPVIVSTTTEVVLATPSGTENVRAEVTSTPTEA